MMAIDIQLASNHPQIPSSKNILRWADNVLVRQQQADCTIRIIDEKEARSLNSQFRHKDYATNVLAFPADLGDEIELQLLGDIVICADVVVREAQEQGKIIDAHWAHMVTHGLLHLLGFDHINDEDAETMELMEVELLAKLNIDNPY